MAFLCVHFYIFIYRIIEWVVLKGAFKDHLVQSPYTQTLKDMLAHLDIYSIVLLSCTWSEEWFQLCRETNTKVVWQYMGLAILDNDLSVTQCTSEIFLALKCIHSIWKDEFSLIWLFSLLLTEDQWEKVVISMTKQIALSIFDSIFMYATQFNSF